MGILRFLLAISVVTAHIGLIFNIGFIGGQIAVQAFYIISGFYMTLILNEKYIGKNKSYKLFLSNRFLRLFPTYWVVLILTLIFSSIHGYFSQDHYYFNLTGYSDYYIGAPALGVMILSNLFLFGQDLFMFMGLHPENGQLFFTSNYIQTNPRLYTFIFVPQAWTLSLELCFYVIAPFLLRRNWKVILMLIALSLTLRLYIYFRLGFIYEPWTYRFFPTELFFFFVGYFSYKLSVKLKTIHFSSVFNYSILVFILLFTTFYSFIPSFGYPILLIEIGYFICIAISIAFLFNFFKTNKLDNKIGELSYPIYISHVLVMITFPLNIEFSIYQKISILAITILVSFILNKWVNEPIEKLRQSRLTT